LAISTFILDHKKFLFKVLVHLGTAGMNREFGHMSLIKDCLLNFWIDRNHEAFSKPDHILVILWKHVYLGSPSASFYLMFCMSSSLR
jgi:hypothetical protein